MSRSKHMRHNETLKHIGAKNGKSNDLSQSKMKYQSKSAGSAQGQWS